MIQNQMGAPVKEPLAPPIPKRNPSPPFRPEPVRVPAPAPLPEKRPTFEPGRERPTYSPPDPIPKPLQPYCPVPE